MNPANSSPAIPRLLIVDDNEAIHRDFVKVLGPHVINVELDELEAELFGVEPIETQRQEYDIVSCSQGMEGVHLVQQSILDDKPYSVAFVDMRMPPGIDGLETIERLWAHDPDVEIVICSAYSDYSWDEIAQRLGHSDRWLLLRKPFDSTEVLQLAAALSEKWKLRKAADVTLAELGQMVRARTDELEKQVAERDAAHHALQKSARTDALTGLRNRTCAMNRIREQCDRLDTDCKTSFSVLFLDLDNFKMINDSLGHDSGDKALIGVAQRTLDVLANHLDSRRAAEESVFRIGGDEFVIVLGTDVSTSQAESIAEQLLIELGHPIDLGGREVVVGLSIGMAVGGEDFRRPEDVLSAADAAMYHAKHQGRGRLERFSIPLFQEARERAVLADELRCAIDRDQITLVYEPIFCTMTGRIISFEALARWQRDDGLCIPPLQFIPIAEETGMIVSLGEWILDRACRDLLWITQSGSNPLELPQVNVNFSKRQLVEPDIAERVRAITLASGLHSTRLNVEVTESAIMEGPDRLSRVIEDFQNTGIGVHMDDFGTGLSSLSYLQRYPFQTIKIDRSFISSMNSSERDAAIVRAILTMAKELGMEVIAEGVETDTQASELTTLRCEYLQGHLLSRPLTRDAAKVMYDGMLLQNQGKRDEDAA